MKPLDLFLLQFNFNACSNERKLKFLAGANFGDQVTNIRYTGTILCEFVYSMHLAR